jgi:hypothetical protein
MDRFRPYNLFFLAALTAVLGPLSLFSLRLEPLSGNLTRLGGYSENDFGWTMAQERIVSLTDPIEKNGIYDRPVDILVFGDSFSKSGLWQNDFREKTSLSITTLNLNATSVEEVVGSPTFKVSPPRILIYESVELFLRDRFYNGTRDCHIIPSTGTPPLRISEVEMRRAAWTRQNTAAWTRIDPGLAANFLFKNLSRDLLSIDPFQVARFRLSRADLFSNRSADHILIYKMDLQKQSWTPEQVESIRCGLIDLQNRVQANGRTFFVLLVAPDKLTAYSTYIMDRDFTKFSQLDRLASDPGLHLPRVDQALKKAIDAGVKDVYLPDDTHWGSAGYKIAAETLVEYLKEKGIFVEKNPN